MASGVRARRPLDCDQDRLGKGKDHAGARRGCYSTAPLIQVTWPQSNKSNVEPVTPSHAPLALAFALIVGHARARRAHSDVADDTTKPLTYQFNLLILRFQDPCA